jgi:hypothetical protein
MTSVTVTSTPFQVSVDDAGTSVTVAATGPAGQGVPAGGSTDQILKKINGTDYATTWAAGGTGDMLASNNLSEVNAATARVNLGATAVGDAVFIAATQAAARSAIGVGLGDLVASNNLSELTATAATVRTNLGVPATNHNHSAGNITSGILAVDRIPDLAASKITSGTIDAARIPTLLTGSISGLGDSAVKNVGTASDEVAAGNDSRFTDARTPVAHSADLVTSGTLAAARGGTGVASIPMVGVISAADAGAARTVLELGTAAVLAVGISDTNVLQANAVVADNDFLRIDGTTVEGRSAAEVLSDIGASPTAGNVSLVTTGTIGTGVWNATAILDTKIDLRVDHGVTFDGGGSVIESGKVVYVPVERAGVIKAATLVADASGAITITITKYDPDADATTLGSSAAVGSIALATKIINRDTTLSGWTLAVAEGDVLAFTTGGTIATVTRVTCKLKVELA